MKKEFKRIKGLSKRIIGRKKYKKVKKVKNYGERTEGLKYLVSSHLKLKLLELEDKLKGVESSLKIDAKKEIIPSKIKIFESTFEKKDYDQIIKLIDEIEGEIKNVRVLKKEKERR